MMGKLPNPYCHFSNSPHSEMGSKTGRARLASPVRMMTGIQGCLP